MWRGVRCAGGVVIGVGGWSDSRCVPELVIGLLVEW